MSNATMIEDSTRIEEIVKAVLVALQPEPQEEPETLVPEITVKTYKRLDDYPDVLKARHVRAILDISEAKAYEILNSKKCPTLGIGKAGKRVRKEAFIQYLIDNEYGSLLD